MQTAHTCATAPSAGRATFAPNSDAPHTMPAFAPSSYHKPRLKVSLPTVVPMRQMFTVVPGYSCICFALCPWSLWVLGSLFTRPTLSPGHHALWCALCGLAVCISLMVCSLLCTLYKRPATRVLLVIVAALPQFVPWIFANSLFPLTPWAALGSAIYYMLTGHRFGLQFIISTLMFFLTVFLMLVLRVETLWCDASVFFETEQRFLALLAVCLYGVSLLVFRHIYSIACIFSRSIHYPEFTLQGVPYCNVLQRSILSSFASALGAVDAAVLSSTLANRGRFGGACYNSLPRRRRPQHLLNDPFDALLLHDAAVQGENPPLLALCSHRACCDLFPDVPPKLPPTVPPPYAHLVKLILLFCRTRHPGHTDAVLNLLKDPRTQSLQDIQARWFKARDVLLAQEYKLLLQIVDFKKRAKRGTAQLSDRLAKPYHSENDSSHSDNYNKHLSFRQHINSIPRGIDRDVCAPILPSFHAGSDCPISKHRQPPLSPPCMRLGSPPGPPLLSQNGDRPQLHKPLRVHSHQTAVQQSCSLSGTMNKQNADLSAEKGYRRHSSHPLPAIAIRKQANTAPSIRSLFVSRPRSAVRPFFSSPRPSAFQGARGALRHWLPTWLHRRKDRSPSVAGHSALNSRVDEIRRDSLIHRSRTNLEDSPGPVDATRKQSLLSLADDSAQSRKLAGAVAKNMNSNVDGDQTSKRLLQPARGEKLRGSPVHRRCRRILGVKVVENILAPVQVKRLFQESAKHTTDYLEQSASCVSDHCRAAQCIHEQHSSIFATSNSEPSPCLLRTASRHPRRRFHIRPNGRRLVQRVMPHPVRAQRRGCSRQGGNGLRPRSSHAPTPNFYSFSDALKNLSLSTTFPARHFCDPQSLSTYDDRPSTASSQFSSVPPCASFATGIFTQHVPGHPSHHVTHQQATAMLRCAQLVTARRSKGRSIAHGEHRRRSATVPVGGLLDASSIFVDTTHQSTVTTPPVPSLAGRFKHYPDDSAAKPAGAEEYWVLRAHFGLSAEDVQIIFGDLSDADAAFGASPYHSLSLKEMDELLAPGCHATSCQGESTGRPTMAAYFRSARRLWGDFLASLSGYWEVVCYFFFACESPAYLWGRGSVSYSVDEPEEELAVALGFHSLRKMYPLSSVPWLPCLINWKLIKNFWRVVSHNVNIIEEKILSATWRGEVCFPSTDYLLTFRSDKCERFFLAWDQSYSNLYNHNTFIWHMALVTVVYVVLWILSVTPMHVATEGKAFFDPRFHTLLFWRFAGGLFASLILSHIMRFGNPSSPKYAFVTRLCGGGISILNIALLQADIGVAIARWHNPEMSCLMVGTEAAGECARKLRAMMRKDVFFYMGSTLLMPLLPLISLDHCRTVWVLNWLWLVAENIMWWYHGGELYLGLRMNLTLGITNIISTFFVARGMEVFRRSVFAKYVLPYLLFLDDFNRYKAPHGQLPRSSKPHVTIAVGCPFKWRKNIIQKTENRATCTSSVVDYEHRRKHSRTQEHLRQYLNQRYPTVCPVEMPPLLQ
eukprot:GHVT01002505.1.p1 GENE.GHVT01002505.1~~GHVT01002505.1.p1  ORF type:complete len:1508 (-),score=85.75 GHVT01002505.1:3385-7908(-)